MSVIQKYKSCSIVGWTTATAEFWCELSEVAVSVTIFEFYRIRRIDCTNGFECSRRCTRAHSLTSSCARFPRVFRSFSHFSRIDNFCFHVNLVRLLLTIVIHRDRTSSGFSSYFSFAYNGRSRRDFNIACYSSTRCFSIGLHLNQLVLTTQRQ